MVTGSVSGNVLKYIGVKNDNAWTRQPLEQGSHQFDELPNPRKDFPFLFFTKAKYAASFEHLHFNLLAKTDEAAFLENGTPDIQDYLHDLPKIDDQANKKIAAIVMNANPFTLGHKHWLPVQ